MRFCPDLMESSQKLSGSEKSSAEGILPPLFRGREAMKQEIPKPMAIGLIVVLVIAIAAAGYFYLNRQETYTPGSGGSAGGQMQQLPPMVPGQSPGVAPPQGQGGGPTSAQPF